MISCVGAGAYFLSLKRVEIPACSCEAPPVASPVLPSSVAAPTPIVLAEVIELADLDPLLDPPTRPVEGAPFDPDPQPQPQVIPIPESIPLSVD
jgi:hypothetical protein